MKHDLAELKRLHAAAKRGEWFWTGGLTVNALTGRRCYDELRCESGCVINEELECDEVDAALIAALRNAAPALIALAEAAVGWIDGTEPGCRRRLLEAAAPFRKESEDGR